MALEHLALARGERAALAQDLLRDRDLAEVVKAAREADELDLLLRQAEARRARGRQLADPLGVAADVRVARVDRTGERGGRVQARDPVGAGRELLEVLGDGPVGLVDPDAVLSLGLRPVEGDVGDAHELAALGAVLGERRDAGREADRAAVLGRVRAERDDEPLGLRERVLFAAPGQDERELVAAETEGVPGRAAGGSRPARAPCRRPDGRSGR